MNVKFSVKPNQLSQEYRYTAACNDYFPISLAYIGRFTYCWNTSIDSGLEFSLPHQMAYHNLHIGSFCSIAENLNIFVGRNHNIKAISTGAVELLGKSLGINSAAVESDFNQKSFVMIQNDVWIGDNVTIMPNVIVHNGACVAKNSHVVKDVPPYAIVGGNPARIIGYRYSPEQISNLLKLQWWYWDINTIKERIPFFNEDPDDFYNRFRSSEYEKNIEDMIPHKESNHYFAFVDYYENYPAYPQILDRFISLFFDSSSHKLTLAIQDEYLNNNSLYSTYIAELEQVIDSINKTEEIQCIVELVSGNRNSLIKVFSSCSDYFVSRTYDSVYFASLADLLHINILSGTDSKIQFNEHHNIYHSSEE